MNREAELGHIDVRNFVDLVTSMRDAQKKYFRTRGNAELHTAKDYERRVDQAINVIKRLKSAAAQPRMF
jgi:hypothetical protein